MKYDIDNLNRVTRADEGTFSAGSISNRSRQENWTLEQAGNSELNQLDLDGDFNFNEAGELNDDRTHNVVNEITARDTDDNGTNNYTLTHDAVGNMTDDGMAYKMVYDVWGRLRMIKNQSNNLVAEYRYNGLNQRLSWHYDTDADGDCDSNDKTYYFAYDDQWRVVATFRDSDTSPKERFLYHAAGLGGYGGAGGGIGGYIDHVIFRDKDANTAWDTASDGTLEERIYYCQNWRADVSAILTSSGKLVEWIKYSAYGTPFALPVGDTDSDGDWDLTDLGNMAGGYEVRKDTELDGDVDANDVNYAIGYGYLTLGRGVLSASGIANRKGYAGYENDGAIVRFAHVRNRVLDSTLGRWTRRDPLGYVDGMGLYEYCASRSAVLSDPLGLTWWECGASRNNVHVLSPISPCYCCPSGHGEQVFFPTNSCDSCCTAACNQRPTVPPGSRYVLPNARTACCGKDATVCICSDNVHTNGARSPCFAELLIASGCLAVHEGQHQSDIDCSSVPDCQLRTSLGGGGLPWRAGECGGYCSECAAYGLEADCISRSIDCNQCTDRATCERSKSNYITSLKKAQQRFCFDCAVCITNPGP